MGIRYYAYAFDAPLAEQAFLDPRSVLSDDPLADAWGLEPHATISQPTFEQAVPRRDMLYLDKAWSHLQLLTAPSDRHPDGRPSFRMFEGQVTMHDLGWHQWVRTLVPDEIPAIADDLNDLDGDDVVDALRGFTRFGGDPDEEAGYAREYLRKARVFVEGLVADHRGMVYMIG